MTSAKILFAQGGGPTAVINQSLAGVVLEARRQPGVERVPGSGMPDAFRLRPNPIAKRLRDGGPGRAG